jgi:hypothetical protein
MNIQEAIKSKKWFTRNGQTFSRYYEAGTGPKKDLVSCDYFMHKEDTEEYFSTSIDLYPEDIVTSDYKTLDD